ncbi:MAG: NUDIX hydrolase [Actinomycetes bacterium]
MATSSGPRDELVEEVDVDGRVLRVVPRWQMRRERLRHRCTFVVVRSSRSEVLIHQRSATKDLWPGRWDIAAGGVVQAGEPWEVAARPELAEELGVDGVDLSPLGTGSYEDDDVAEIARVWSVVSDGPFTFTDAEVVAARFVSLAELAARVAVDSFVPDSLAVVLPFLE